MVRMFRADDGKEFFSPSECLKYERKCAMRDSWDRESAKDISNPEHVTFDQFLDKSGLSKQNYYRVHVIVCIYRAFERSGWKCQYGLLTDAPMEYVIDFLRNTDFSDTRIWRRFGSKTASILFFHIVTMFDIDLWPKYALERGII